MRSNILILCSLVIATVTLSSCQKDTPASPVTDRKYLIKIESTITDSDALGKFTTLSTTLFNYDASNRIKSIVEKDIDLSSGDVDFNDSSAYYYNGTSVFPFKSIPYDLLDPGSEIPTLYFYNSAGKIVEDSTEDVVHFYTYNPGQLIIKAVDHFYNLTVYDTLTLGGDGVNYSIITERDPLTGELALYEVEYNTTVLNPFAGIPPGIWNFLQFGGFNKNAVSKIKYTDDAGNPQTISYQYTDVKNGLPGKVTVTGSENPAEPLVENYTYR